MRIEIYFQRIPSGNHMNFELMPELKWRWGYPAVLLLMVAISLLMFYYFKKKKWF